MSQNSTVKTMIVVALLGIFTSACEMKKNLDDMHTSTVEMGDTTKDMSKTTQDMSQTTKDMSVTTKDMSQTTKEMNETTKRMEQKTSELDKKSGALDAKTAELYDALRQGNAAILRKDFLDQMTASNEMPKKLALGVKYFWAFEFQLWSMQGLDDSARREELASSAAREFIREIHEYAPKNDFISPRTKDNYEKNFLALATTLHEVNDKQKNRIDKAGLTRMSMLSLIERALIEKRALASGQISVDQLSPSSYDLLNFEDKLAQILQARHNFLLAMLVSKASNVDKAWTKKVTLGVLGMSWTLDLSKFNDVEIAEMKRFAKAALETRLILNRAGYAIEADKTLTKILRNSIIKRGTSKTLVRHTTEDQLLAYINNIKSTPVILK